MVHALPGPELPTEMHLHDEAVLQDHVHPLSRPPPSFHWDPSLPDGISVRRPPSTPQRRFPAGLAASTRTPNLDARRTNSSSHGAVGAAHDLGDLRYSAPPQVHRNHKTLLRRVIPWHDESVRGGLVGIYEKGHSWTDRQKGREPRVITRGSLLALPSLRATPRRSSWAKLQAPEQQERAPRPRSALPASRGRDLHRRRDRLRSRTRSQGQTGAHPNNHSNC